MSDAMTDSYRMQVQGEAENAFHEALIRYLHNPTPAHIGRVNDKIEELALVYRDKNARDSIKEMFDKYNSNDRETWRKLVEREKSLFEKKPELLRLLKEAAMKRGIGNMEWVI